MTTTLTVPLATHPTVPVLDAQALLALATALDAASKPRRAGRGARRGATALRADLVEALTDVRADRAALASALGAPARSKGRGVKALDAKMDRVMSAMHGLLIEWSRLAAELEQGRVASKLLGQVFGTEDRSYVRLPVDKEHAYIDVRLEVLRRAGLAPTFASLGLAPVLALVEAVFKDYGAALGLTAPKAEQPAPAHVQDSLRALRGSVQVYIDRVWGMRSRTDGKANARVAQLLEPLGVAATSSDRSRARRRSSRATPPPAQAAAASTDTTATTAQSAPAPAARRTRRTRRTRR